MLTIRLYKKFKRDYKCLQKRGYNVDLLDEVVRMLAAGKPLPPKYRDHPLSGDYAGCRECHMATDWLLVYEAWQEEPILYLMRTGTHSDLF